MNSEPLDIELCKQNTYIAVPKSKQRERVSIKVMSWMYSLFITILMGWLIPYTIYMSIRDKVIIHFGRSLFQLVIVLQYFLAIRYFCRNHFYKNIVCNTDLLRRVKIVLPIVSTTSIILSIINLCLLNVGKDLFVYTDVYVKCSTIGKIFMSILIFFSSLYSYLTFSINACIFAINMIYHKRTVSKYSKNLDHYIKNSMNTVRKLNIIASEYSQMKDKYEQTVELFTPFFSTLNFVGFATMYFYLMTISNKTICATEIINIGLFLIIQLVYIISIQAVNNNISDISDCVVSSNIIATFFGNKKFNRTLPSFDKNESTEESHKNLDDDLQIERQDKECQDGIKNETYAFIGTEIYKHITEKEGTSSTPVECRKNKTSKNCIECSDEDIEYHKNEHKKYVNDNSKGISEEYLINNYNINKQVLISSISSEQMIDWLVLQGIVNEKWSTFKVFGIEFTDSTLISKLVGIATAAFIASEIGVIANWW
jgi:hypothetical protein